MREASIGKLARAIAASVAVIALVSSLAASAPADAAADRGIARPTPHGSAPAAGKGLSPGAHADGQILVRFRSGVSGTASARGAHARLGTKTKKRFTVVDGLELVTLPLGISVEDAVAAFQAMPEVLYAEPDYVLTISGPPVTPNDTFYGVEWGLNNTGQRVPNDPTGVYGTPDADIDAPEAWGITTGSSSVVIAVIDTGVQYTHPDLAGNMWTNPGEIPGDGIDNDANGYIDDVYGIDTFNHDSDPLDDHGHGTHCSGTIGAQGNNSAGVVGVNWDTSIMALKAFSSTGQSTTSATLEAMQYARDKGADVISCSWGGWYPLSTSPGSEYEAIANMSSTLFVFAAGNEGKDVTGSWPGGYIGAAYFPANASWFHYPSSYDLANILAVGASDQNDACANFSNYSATNVDVFAPGVKIGSTWNASNYGYMDGTSMATPHVAGVAGLLLSRTAALTPAQLKSAIMNTVDAKASLSGKCVTGGRLNAYNALSAPVAFDDAYTTNEDTAKVLAVLANDTDANGDPLTPTAVGGVSHGSLVANLDKTFTYTPEANWNGTDSFTYKANDGQFDSGVAAVTITVTPVNDPPSFTKGADVSVAENSGAYSAPWATAISPGPNEPAQTVSFTVTAATPSLFSVQPSVSAAGTLTFTPAANTTGVSNVSVTLTDSLGAASATEVFSIAVTGPNNPPSFTKGGAVIVDEDSGAYSGAWATAISPGAGEAAQTVHFHVSAGTPALFSVQPAIDSAGNLTFTTAANAFGVTTVSVTLEDSLGGLSATETFAITLTPVNDPPSFTAGPNLSVGRGAYSAGWATNVSPGPLETAQTVHFHVTAATPGLFSVQPAIDPAGTLGFTPAVGVYGSSTVTVTLEDSLGAIAGPRTFTITVDTLANPPTGLSATAVDMSSIRLAWAASSDPSGVLKYRIYRSDGTYLTEVTGATLTQVVTGLAAGTRYDFYITMVDNRSNESAPSGVAGATTIAPAPVVPVYRFYSARSGTHFYTPSVEERDMVIALWSDVYAFEGVAYTVNPAKNYQPLYRFYNRSNGSHFYTASDQERDTVLAIYSNVFSYDGPSYLVTPVAQAGKTPVYRFFNLRNGSHFYTASLDEANHVIATWPDTYRLEGPAFWLGQ